ncbi:hypothetical protein [Streptomyces sp. NPDC002205]|uniref:hypothetical protein n=1 Tax=Streptomyces sp. NPDC002205 TaxID=3154411 RepID=UPI003316F265
MASSPLAYARSRLVSASAAAGPCPPVDGVTTSVTDMDALTADIVHARRLGFTGKLCIHPAQIAAVTAHFTPTESKQRWARAVVTASDSPSPWSTGRWLTSPCWNGLAESSPPPIAEVEPHRAIADAAAHAKVGYFVYGSGGPPSCGVAVGVVVDP